MNTHNLLLAALLALGVTTAGAANTVAESGNDASASPTGEALAHTCAACHGTLGRLQDDHFVPLAGMKPEEFIASMKSFKDLKRPSSIMSHIAEGYSDGDIERMAAFFASVPKGEEK